MTFEDFYEAHRGRKPFPWMSRLANLFASGELPTVVDLPTGSGKSDLVFAWAWARLVNRQLPRRLWMVSDRRVIVDQSYEVAKLVEGLDGILVSRLRGGIVADDDAMLDPVRPQIIATTVDQLGSRLLFRGYGASPRSWPIWAALAGNDSLIVLDEAHLSPIAEDTFRACQERFGAQIHIVCMSATPRGESGTVFTLDAADADHPILGQRLNAARWVHLWDGGSLANAAHELMAEGCTRVAVICNTVRAARAAFSAIEHSDKHLIIGRQRPLDRDRQLTQLMPRLRSGADPTSPLVVVSTQCIEAGADFDFDGMVSEACPIDSLLQRLGRLDRLGTQGESRCILVKPTESDTPPYGASPQATWRWLVKHSNMRAKRRTIDLGSKGWSKLRSSVPEEARCSQPKPVTLLKPHLRMLTWTSPRPIVEPDVDLLLHGRDRAPGAVSLVWRREPAIATGDPRAVEILSILPPSALESCEVPLWEVKAWLTRQDVRFDSGDVEGGVLPKVPSEEPDASTAKILRWDGQDEGATSIDVKQLKPGDVVILPSDRGGYDQFGWNPASIAAVPDIGDDAYFARTGRTIERYDNVEVEVNGDRVRRWSGGVVVEHLPAEQKGLKLRDVEVTLDVHKQAVADRARSYATELGLDHEAVYDAGFHHDDGKANKQWQLSVNGGRIDRLVEAPLAKGTYVRSPLSRLPSGWRHEAESLALLPPSTAPLVRWLIATHHGYARPFWPCADHGIGLAELMDRLQAHYGPWGLALYEAVLRCADRAVSREEVERGRSAP